MNELREQLCQPLLMTPNVILRERFDSVTVSVILNLKANTDTDKASPCIESGTLHHQSEKYSINIMKT